MLANSSNLTVRPRKHPPSNERTDISVHRFVLSELTTRDRIFLAWSSEYLPLANFLSTFLCSNACTVIASSPCKYYGLLVVSFPTVSNWLANSSTSILSFWTSTSFLARVTNSAMFLVPRIPSPASLPLEILFGNLPVVIFRFPVLERSRSVLTNCWPAACCSVFAIPPLLFSVTGLQKN